MPFYDLFTKPWCTGRTYNNCPATHKVWSLFRGPPFWWIVNISGLDPDPRGDNSAHYLQPYLYNFGTDPVVSWAKDAGVLVPWVNLAVKIENSAVAGEKKFHLSYTYGNDFNQLIEFDLRIGPPVINWRSLDGLIFNVETFRSPLWEHGDPTFQLQVGEYDRLPAQSCRGDYNGEWP